MDKQNKNKEIPEYLSDDVFKNTLKTLCTLPEEFEYIEKHILDLHVSGKGKYNKVIFSLIMFQNWLEKNGDVAL